MKINRITVAVLPLLFSAATVFAQAPQSSIRESTDPARVAEVERRAQQLRSAQSAAGGGGQTQGQTQAQPRRPADADRGPMRRDGMRGDGRGYGHGHGHGQAHGHGHGQAHGHGHGNPRMHHDHPKAAPNSGK